MVLMFSGGHTHTTHAEFWPATLDGRDFQRYDNAAAAAAPSSLQLCQQFPGPTNRTTFCRYTAKDRDIALEVGKIFGKFSFFFDI